MTSLDLLLNKAGFFTHEILLSEMRANLKLFTINQHEQPLLSLGMSMGIVSGKSELKSVDSSWASACLAIALKEALLVVVAIIDSGDLLSKACSTLIASFALVSKYGMPPFA